MPDQPILQRVAGKALIVNEAGKLLILREAPTYDEGTNIGRYHFPGGRINPGEPFFDGLRREISEETGLAVEVGKPVFVSEWFPTIKGTPNHIVAMFFICKPLGDTITLSSEHDDYQWIDPTELHKFDVMGPEPEAVKAWLAL